MWLPGFDAPILYCMYLDKPMWDHVLLLAIARVNRPYEDDEGWRKPCGFVLDFLRLFNKLEKALKLDSEDVEGVRGGDSSLWGGRGAGEICSPDASQRGCALGCIVKHFMERGRYQSRRGALTPWNRPGDFCTSAAWLPPEQWA